MKRKVGTLLSKPSLRGVMLASARPAPAGHHPLEHERKSAGVGATAIYESRGIKSAPTGRLLTDNLAVKARIVRQA